MGIISTLPDLEAQIIVTGALGGVAFAGLVNTIVDFWLGEQVKTKSIQRNITINLALRASSNNPSAEVNSYQRTMENLYRSRNLTMAESERRMFDCQYFSGINQTDANGNKYLKCAVNPGLDCLECKEFRKNNGHEKNS